ncbi:hypothetical protein MD484_g5121, partial [Candolleomyces efflorescens]
MASQDTDQVLGSRSAVKNRVPTKVLAGFGARRSSQEVKAANQAAAAAAKTAQERAQARHDAVQHRISQLEDDLQREDARRRKIAARPDLHEKSAKRAQATAPKKLKVVTKPPTASAAPAPVSRASEPHSPLAAEDGDAHSDVGELAVGAAGRSEQDMGTAGGSDIDSGVRVTAQHPAVSQRSLSPASAPMDSENIMGVPLQVGRKYQDDDDDGGDDDDDNDGDSDYQEDGQVDESEEEDSSGVADGNSQSLSKSKKAKAKQGGKAVNATKAAKGALYRSEVNARRETSSTSAISKAVQNKLLKRKERDDEVDDGELETKKGHGDGGKRAKHEEPSGLLKGFRAATAKKKRLVESSRRSQSLTSEMLDTDEYAGGAFDDDEDEEALAVARKGKMKVTTRGSKPQTTVQVVEPEAGILPLSITRRKFKKEYCKKSNLPFPERNASRCLALWNHGFKSTLIAWNATLRQPFSSGTLLSSQVKTAWEAVFGNLAPLDEDDERWHIVEIVAGDFLLNWRSELGRVAISVTVGTLRHELKEEIKEGKLQGNEAGVEAAKHLLNDHQFVYGNPDAEEGESAEPFQSPLLLDTFSSHLKQVVHKVKNYDLSGEPIGALGLCAAAVSSLDISPPFDTTDIVIGRLKGLLP